MNAIFVIENETGRQLDAAAITLDRGVIDKVVDENGGVYEDGNVALLTTRDFIHVKDLDLPLCVGDEIYLDNQSQQRWVVRYGWYEVDGNPAICGWYLESVPIGRIRSLYLKDLHHLTMVTPRTGYRLPDVIRED